MNRTVENKRDLNMGLKRISIINLLEGNCSFNGKRVLAERSIFCSLRSIKNFTSLPLLLYLKKAVVEVQPLVHIISKKVGGGVYKIPVYIYLHKSRALSIKWLVQVSSVRKSGSFIKNFEKELASAVLRDGLSVQKKKLLHALAVANRAYIKYL